MTHPEPAPQHLEVPDVTGMDAMTAAFEYAKHHWYVGPVRRGTKNPGSILGKKWQSATTRDPQIIADYWMKHTTAGVFLHVGRSGGIVLDVDNPAGGMPDILTDALTEHPAPFQRTRRRDASRRHYVYRQPTGRTLGNGLGALPPGWGDVRGANGVIIVAPSEHPEPDGHYVWGRTGPVPELPAALADKLTDTRTPNPDGSIPGPVDVATDPAIKTFITTHDQGDDYGKARAMIASFRSCIADGDSRHQRAVSILTGMLKEAAAGYYPAAHAELELRTAFLDAVTQPGHGGQGHARSGVQAVEEWRGILAWAVAQADHADVMTTIERAEDLAPRDLSSLIDTRPTPAATTSSTPAPAPGTPRQDDTGPDDPADTPPATAAPAPVSDLDRLLDPTTAAQAAADDPAPSWRPLNLTSILNGDYSPPQPTIMRRTDGPGLFYPGKVHTVYGESESGKSWIAQHATTTVLHDGQRVLYIDFESDAPDVTGRLTTLGTTHDQLLGDGFAYVRPEASPHTFAEAPEFASLLEQQWDLAILDGVTEALGLSGKSTMDNDEITTWMRDIPRTIARRTGAAVILVDHVVKATEGRGRFPIGGQAKMAAIDGTGYLVEPLGALGRGLDGSLTVRVAKDRPGQVRAHAGDWRKTDRTQEAARFRLDSTAEDGTTTVTVQPPEFGELQAHDNAQPFCPTKVMEKISRILETMREPVSRQAVIRAYRETGKAKETTIVDALNLLKDAGAISESQGPRNARMFRSASVYRSHNDPLSDDFRGDLSAYDTTSSRPHPDLIPDEDATSSQRPHPTPSPLREGVEVEERVGEQGTPPPHPAQQTYIDKHTGEIHGGEDTTR